ncbi:MAG TPA: hypothetical protein VGS19_13880, partial [Streptosporangiaceae bacterium]|nr:hypothetical protein [Streptosporangiaceae bacterium]
MNRRAARWLAACVPFGLVMAMLAQALSAAAAGTPGPRVRPAAAPPSPSRLASPAAVLPRGWRSSRDREVTVAADAAGLHVLVADEAAGYAWRTVATLGVPGVDTTEWVGQACVTASGTRAVVVYAPRQITNMGAAQGTAALAAVVDLGSGTVTPVAGGFSIAYFSPGCGTGEQTVLSQGGWGEARPGSLDATRLVLIDARTGKTVYAVTERGQVTSPVPYRGQIAAAYGPGLVTIGAGGRVRTLTRTRGAAFRLAPDSAGGLGYQVMAGGQVQVRRYAAGRDQLVGTAPAGSVDLAQVSGHVWVTGPHASGLGRLPAGWRAANVPVLSQVSTGGTLVVTSVASARPQGRGPQAAPGSPWPVQIGAQVISTGKHVAFTVPTGLPS